MNSNFCRNCGRPIEPGTKFCPGCGCTVSSDFRYGENQNGYYRQNFREKKINTGLLIFSIVNMVLGGFILGLISLILVINAKDAETDEDEAEKLRIAKILNIVSISLIGASVVFGILTTLGVFALIFSVPLFSISAFIL